MERISCPLLLFRIYRICRAGSLHPDTYQMGNQQIARNWNSLHRNRVSGDSIWILPQLAYHHRLLYSGTKLAFLHIQHSPHDLRDVHHTSPYRLRCEMALQPCKENLDSELRHLSNAHIRAHLHVPLAEPHDRLDTSHNGRGVGSHVCLLRPYHLDSLKDTRQQIHHRIKIPIPSPKTFNPILHKKGRTASCIPYLFIANNCSALLIKIFRTVNFSHYFTNICLPLSNHRDSMFTTSR